MVLEDVTAESIASLDDDVTATPPEIAESDITEEDINLFFLQSFLYLELSLSRKNPLVHFEFATESVPCITKLSSNEIRETSCEGLKCMCTMFEINVQQDF